MQRKWYSTVVHLKKIAYFLLHLKSRDDVKELKLDQRFFRCSGTLKNENKYRFSKLSDILIEFELC